MRCVGATSAGGTWSGCASSAGFSIDGCIVVHLVSGLRLLTALRSRRAARGCHSLRVAVPRRSSPGEAPGTVFVPLAVRAKKLAQERQVVGAVALEGRHDFTAVAVQLTGSTTEQRREGDHDLAAIVGILQSADVTTLLESIEHGRDCASAQPERLGDGAGGHRSTLVEDVQAPMVGCIYPEPLGDRVVEGRNR